MLSQKFYLYFFSLFIPLSLNISKIYQKMNFTTKYISKYLIFSDSANISKRRQVKTWLGKNADIFIQFFCRIAATDCSGRRHGNRQRRVLRRRSRQNNRLRQQNCEENFAGTEDRSGGHQNCYFTGFNFSCFFYESLYLLKKYIFWIFFSFFLLVSIGQLNA